MAIVVVATTKGGSGKSTTATNFAATAWASGNSVAIFDCDPQKHSLLMINQYKKALTQEHPERLEKRGPLDVIIDVAAEQIVEQIREADRAYDLTVIDLQGSANQLMLLAITQADLVVLPVQPSMLDINGVTAAWRQVKQASTITGREIPSVAFFVRTPPAIQPKVLTNTRKNFIEKGLRVMTSEFVERSVIKEISFTGRMPTEFQPESKAAANVRAFTKEIFDLLRETMMAGEAECEQA
jgi:chromosome partitioning protein